ncbi:hypothetical protein PENTCL1PPCAC_7471 [Pristionchus entomophagus]|uniref:Rap-GAP domain-containing protein n=1 Tax=Pristionchus entomophagus TaxID=358040 RepID=A0AAV5T0P3_9BILA|nr:hypothetical protein PENTCL1PPCAC_7471 [Pristionchus entomophagus]
MAIRSQTLPASSTSSTCLLRDSTMSAPSETASSSVAASGGGSNVGSPTSVTTAPPSAAAAAAQQASPARRQGLMSSITRNIFGTGSRDRTERNSIVDLVTQEGSIKKDAWNLMGRGNPNKTRLRTLDNLKESSPRMSPKPVRRHPSIKNRFGFLRLFDGQRHSDACTQVMKNRNLQVSTLEGIWHESKDMLTDPDTREPTLKLFIELTITQHQQLGLALRHTFFEKIRDMGCEYLTIKWLNALSEDCKNVNGFEKAMDFLVADWMQSVLSQEDNNEAYRVIQLAEQLVMYNSAFVCEASMITLVRSSCSRCARLLDPLTSPCLDLLTTIQKYSELPRSELPLIVATLCCLVVIERFCEQSWAVARNLLNSQLGHRTRNILVEIMRSGQESLQISGTDKGRVIRSLRGAVYFIVQSTWGTQKIESVRASPAFVTDALECAVVTDPVVCNDVLAGIRRLVIKFGREIQHITWQRIVRMFHVVHEMIKVDDSYKICRDILSSLLDQLEQLYIDYNYSGSSDELFELLEFCLDCRKDDSIAMIMKYRGRELSQLQPEWLLRAKALVEKYADKGFSKGIRKQAISSLQQLYHQCKSVSEHEIVTTLLLPLLGQLIPVEEECEVQYQMLLTLFDITRSVSVRPGESALFDQVLDVIRRMFVDGLPKCFEASPTETDGVMNYNNVNTEHQDNRQWGGFCMENQEIVVRELDELLIEKWQILPPGTFKSIIDMLISNVSKQYQLHQFNEAGSEVRAAVFNVLFTIRACPITRRLIRLREEDATQPTALPNVFIRLWDGDKKEGEFSWEEIAKVTVQALKNDRSWPVTLAIITGLGKVLEYTEMVRTSGAHSIESLVEALLNVSTRAARGDYFYKEYDETMIEKSRREASGERLRLLPIVLATLIVFTYEMKWENRSHELCRQIVEYAKQGSVEAIIASSIALQRVPDGFASFAPLFVEILAAQEPVHGRAIPVLEFFADAAHVEQFYKFFQFDHFRQVTDCLAPYTIVEYYNPFIVALAHRALMMWFSLVPEKMRPEMRRVMMDRVQRALEYYYPKGMSRQPSGDGRNEASSMYVLGGAPDTPPPMGGAVTARASASEEISEEIERALNAFFWLGKIDDVVEDTVPEKMVEMAQEHFLVNDHILSVRTLAEKEEDDVFTSPPSSSQLPSTSNSTTPTSATAAAAAAMSKEYDGSATPKTFADQRRRYQSAIQSTSNRQMEGRRAMDDMDVERRERSSTASRQVSLPQVTYTQLIVRSMYGRRSWLMRSLELVHMDYEMVRGISEDATSLMQHVAGLPTACVVGKKNDDQVATRLRNLDRVPGLELFAVGVLYKGVGQTSEAEYLKNVYGSERYNKFIKLLGDVRSLTNCPAGLMKGKHGKYTYEYKDAISRIVFLIASLMPTTLNDPNCNEKKKLIGNSFVVVLFNESGSPYQLQHNVYAHVTIEITPVDPVNCMVFVHARPEVLCWIGLRKVVLTDALAARIVRQIVIRANLAVNVYRSTQETPREPYLSMSIARLRMIRALKDKCQPVAPTTAS